jgi:hypothetical protein
MARSYTRLKRRNKKALSVQESPISYAVSANSLYCVPVKETTTTAGTVLKKKGAGYIAAGTAEIDSGVVRIASATFSSKSPFRIGVKNTAQGWSMYQCAGQKVVKINFNRESHVCGNPAAFYSQPVNNENNMALVKVEDCEDQVDMMFNVVVDSAKD